MFKLETKIKAKTFPGIPQLEDEPAFEYVTRIVQLFTNWIEKPITVDVVLTSEKPEVFNHED